MPSLKKIGLQDLSGWSKTRDYDTGILTIAWMSESILQILTRVFLVLNVLVQYPTYTTCLSEVFTIDDVMLLCRPI